MRTSFPVHAPPEAWTAMADPARLAAALPGCRSVTRAGGGDGSPPHPGGDTLEVVTEVAVASVRGLWAGTVARLDADAVLVRGSGVPGAVDLVVRADPDRTTLTVEGTVEGPLATVGSSVLAAALRRTADDLLSALALPPAPAAPAPDPTAAEPSVSARGHGFRSGEAEVMGSGSGTHDLSLVTPEPMTSGTRGLAGRTEVAAPGVAGSPQRGRRLARAAATVAGLGAVLVAGRQWVRRRGASSQREAR